MLFWLVEFFPSCQTFWVYVNEIKVLITSPVVVILIYLHGTRWREWLFILIVPIMIAGIEFLTPLHHKNENSYKKKMEAQEAIDRHTTSLFSPLGNTGLLIFIIFLLLFIISYSAGRSQAFDQVEFLVVNTQPECVVLRTYGEKLICSTFNRNTKEVYPEFRVFEIGADSNLSMNQEKIGPLHLKTFDTSNLATPKIQWVTATPIVTATVTAP